MKRMTKVFRGSLLAVSSIFALACGRDETMASKSAAAYQEAQAKGVPVAGGHEHGGHEAATPALSAAEGTGTAETSHSAHGTGADPHAGHGMSTGAATDHGKHAATSAADHAAMGHGAGGDAHAGHASARGAATDHAAHGATAGAAAHHQDAGMQHGTAAASTDPHAQHQQPATAHAGHGAMQPTAAAPPVAPSAPGATLRPDAFDAPAPIAVEEARKAAGGGGSHQGHGDASQQTVYTCPMHPEVTSATPGNCPKCGMALVKKDG